MRHTLGLLIGITLAIYSNPGAARTKAKPFAVACAADLVGEPTFTTASEARARIEPLRAHVGRHLTPADLAILDRYLGYHSVDEDQLRTLSELVERARRNFTREFTDLADLADDAVAARLKASGKRDRGGDVAALSNLRARFKECRANLTFEKCAGTWRRIQNEFKLKRAPKVYPTRAVAHAGRPVDEVSRLHVLGGEEQKERLREALDRTFDSRGAEARQAYRDDEEAAGHGRRHEYLRTPNLNRALAFFLETPRISELPSKVVVSGPVYVGDCIRDVEVVFDPRDRYVTVQQPGGEGDERYYYRLTLGADGRLVIDDVVPLAKQQVFKNLADTHLGY